MPLYMGFVYKTHVWEGGFLICALAQRGDQQEFTARLSKNELLLPYGFSVSEDRRPAYVSSVNRFFSTAMTPSFLSFPISAERPLRSTMRKSASSWRSKGISKKSFPAFCA